MYPEEGGTLHTPAVLAAATAQAVVVALAFCTRPVARSITRSVMGESVPQVTGGRSYFGDTRSTFRVPLMSLRMTQGNIRSSPCVRHCLVRGRGPVSETIESRNVVTALLYHHHEHSDAHQPKLVPPPPVMRIVFIVTKLYDRCLVLAHSCFL
jgi:hypothetical protein